MKTVNFLEALEANKTQKVKQITIEKARRIEHPIDWPVGELIKNLSNGSHYLAVEEYQGQWEIIPKLEPVSKEEVVEMIGELLARGITNVEVKDVEQFINRIEKAGIA